MALVANTMSSKIISALNASGNFNISTMNTPATDIMIKSACATFIPIYVTFGLDMQPGLGPPLAGSYPHMHTMLGTTLIQKILQYTNTFNTALDLSGQFIPGHQASFAQCWATGILSVLDSAIMLSSSGQGEASHDHFWVTVPVASTVVTNVASCMISSWTFMGQTFKPDSQFKDFIQEFATEFIRAVKADTTWGFATGTLHVHTLS